MIQIHLCPSPDLYSLYHREGAAVIVVDIFRATTTITTAILNGAEGILPVSSTEECLKIGTEHGYLMAAERSVQRCSFAHLGNDPAEYSQERIGGRRIVMTTTNGTRSLNIVQEHGAKHILIGSLLNLSATLDYCLDLGARDIIVLAAGWQGQASMEDMLYAGALGHLAQQRGIGDAATDAATMMRDLWQKTSIGYEDRCAYIAHSEHYERLVRAGHQAAIGYCMQVDTCQLAIGLDETGQWLRRLSPNAPRLHLSPLVSLSQDELSILERTYRESFPIDEQRPWEQITAPHTGLTPWAIHHTNGKLLGIITLWRLSGMLYIEHFCLLSSVRQQGYGAEVIQHLIKHELSPQETLILEAEPQELSPMAARRIAFYQRQGLRVLDYPYIQPAYTSTSTPVSLCLLASHELEDEEIQIAARALHQVVYGYQGGS